MVTTAFERIINRQFPLHFLAVIFLSNHLVLPLIYPMLSDLKFQSADQLPLPELASLVNHCFQGYLVKVHLDHTAIFNTIRVDSVDLAASVVVHCSGQQAGIALVARRGWNSRLAAMAVA